MIRRKNYFIKKRFQLNFVIRFILLILLETLLIAGLFMYISSNTLTTGYLDSILTIERTPQFFFVPGLLIMLIVGIGVAITGMIIFILLSHRIAGPLYRLEQDINAVASGDLTKRINLRRTDQLAELRDAFNLLIDSLDSRMGPIKKKIQELESLLSKGEDEETISKVKKELSLLKMEIENFKVTSNP